MDGLNKRLAALIASQLPNELHEAMQVLSMAREIVLCLEGDAVRQQLEASQLSATGPTGLATLRVVAREGQPYRPDKSNRA